MIDLQSVKSKNETNIKKYSVVRAVIYGSYAKGTT
jgi:predicted nucleotidyltransferase